MKSKVWSQEELNKLKFLYKGNLKEMTSEFPNRTKHAIFNKARELGLTVKPKRVEEGQITTHFAKKYYKYIKINGEQVLYHKYLWVKNFGEYDEKVFTLTFKDGDTLNCSLSNLELISKGELLDRNRNPQKMVLTRLKIISKERYRLSMGMSQRTNMKLTRHKKVEVINTDIVNRGIRL